METSAMLLSIENLHVAFRLGKVDGVVQRFEAVKGVSFDIAENTTVALVGESGSGKSVTAMSILNLLPDNAERQGAITFRGRDMLAASMSELQRLRGREIACVFQDPMTSLNPVFSVGEQLCEPLVKHLGMGSRQALARAEALLEEVGMPEPKRRLSAYPHQLSGGQQQRVMIAMALACEPKLLIADEPTTALDVTIQRQIMELLAGLKTRYRMSMLFISHDLGVVGEIADHVVVMREGTVREQGSVAGIFADPQDAYTKALLACRPTLEQRAPRLMVIDDHISGVAASAATKPKDPQARVIIEARALTKSFWLRSGVFGRKPFHAVKGATFQLRKGHTLGVVGESGSGKTT
ncbi:MAG: ATP-binding cassette domain-containing protein, partial [Burkholderiaceae bacterium]